MSSAQPTPVRTEEEAAVGSNSAAVKGQWKCPLSDRHIHGEDVRKVWKECQEESFWYRALPLSLGSMAVTGGLIYNGIWKSSKRFGPFPKLAGKFHELSLGDRPGFGPWSQGGPFNNHGPGHRSCHHVCEECKKSAQAARTEEVKS